MLSEGPSPEPEFVLLTLRERSRPHVYQSKRRCAARVLGSGQVAAIFGRKRDSKGSGSFRETGSRVCVIPGERVALRAFRVSAPHGIL